MTIMVLVFRISGSSRLFSICASSLFFFAPLAVAKNSINSAIYLFDFVAGPLIVLLFFQGRLRSDKRFPGYLLFISAGLWPFIGGVVYTYTATEFFINAANAYRLAGIIGLTMLGSSREFKLNFSILTNGLMLLGGGVLIMMIMQSRGIIQLNLFDKIQIDTGAYEEAYLNYENFADAKFIILGMFKAHQGVVWMLLGAVGIGMLVSEGERLSAIRGVVLLGLSAGGLILTGSKTSLLALVVMVVAAANVFGIRKTAPALAVITFGFVLLVGFVMTDSSASSIINTTLYSWITSGGKDVDTYDERLSKYATVLGYLSENPLSLFGIPISRVPEVSVVYFHNEYLSILMLGGFVSLLLYLYFLAQVGAALWAYRRTSPFVVSAFLAFLGNLVQAYTVVHLQPGFLFISSVGFSILLYKYGIEVGRMHSKSPPKFEV